MSAAAREEEPDRLLAEVIAERHGPPVRTDRPLPTEAPHVGRGRLFTVTRELNGRSAPEATP